MQNPDEFVQRYQPEGPPPLQCLSVSSAELEERLQPLWDLPRRATLPRLTDGQRRLMGEGLTAARRERCLAYAALFRRREDLAQEANVRGQIFLDLQAKEETLAALGDALSGAARAARDGRLLICAALAALNARVMLHMIERVLDPHTRAARRVELRASLAEVLPANADGPDGAGAIDERRLLALRAQLVEAGRNSALRRFLEQLGAAPGNAP